MTVIRMLETRKGSEDGFTVRQFYAGEIYTIKENLARSFFAAGFAEKHERKKPKKKTEIGKKTENSTKTES